MQPNRRESQGHGSSPGSPRLVGSGRAGVRRIESLPPWLRYLPGADARWLRRQAAVAFLDGLLIAYVSRLDRGDRGDHRLACRRSRGPLSPVRARLLLLSVSVLLCLAGLEAGAAVWRAWLHRSPQLPAAVSGLEANRVPMRSDPSHALPVAKSPARFPPADRPMTRVRPLRFLVIGESSGRGEPYHPWLSVGQIVAWRLEQVFPGRPIDVDIWATGGATLEVMHNKLAGLTYRPDALIVYVGHNEFQARYTWMRDVDYYVDGDRAVRVPLCPRWRDSAQVSPLCRLIEETRERQLVDLLPPRTVTRELVDRPVCTAAESAAILADFGRRLESIAGYCETIGTLPIFVIPPSNDAGFDPSRSVLAPETTRDQRIALARAVSRARALETKDRAAGHSTVSKTLVRSHPEFAETHYRLARLLEQTGRWDEAHGSITSPPARPTRCPCVARALSRGVPRGGAAASRS